MPFNDFVCQNNFILRQWYTFLLTNDVHFNSLLYIYIKRHFNHLAINFPPFNHSHKSWETNFIAFSEIVLRDFDSISMDSSDAVNVQKYHKYFFSLSNTQWQNDHYLFLKVNYGKNIDSTSTFINYLSAFVWPSIKGKKNAIKLHCMPNDYL